MEQAHKIASNTIAQIASKMFNAILSVVIIKIITHYLKTEGYGQYTLVYELVGFFGIACDLGLFTIAVDEMAKTKESMQRVLGSILGLRLILILVIGSLTTGISFLIPNFTPVMSIAVVIAAIGVAANLISSTVAATLQVHLKMTLNAYAIIIGKILMVGYIALTAFFGWGFLHLMIAGLINNLFVTGVTVYASHRLLPIKLYFDRIEIWRLLKKSAVYGVALIFGSIYLRVNTIMLRQFTSDNVVGVFGIALRSYELLLLIPFSFMNSILPSLSQNINTEKFSSLFQKSWDVLVITGLGMSVGSFIMAEEMIKLISTGSDFAPAANLMRILAIASIFNFLSSLFQYVLVSLNRVKVFFAIALLEALAAITFAYLFIPFSPPFGQANAAAWAVVVAQAINFVGVIWGVARLRPIKLSWKATLATIFSVGITGIYLWFIKGALSHTSIFVSLPVAFGTAGLFYIFILTKTGGLSADISKVLLQKFFLGKPSPLPGQKLRIAIDIRGISGERTGKEWYTWSLISALGEIDQNNEYFLFTRHPIKGIVLPNNFHIIEKKIPLLLWHPYFMFQIWKYKADILLATASYIVPSMLISKRPKVITVIHDTIAFLFPRRHQAKATTIERFTLKRALEHSNIVVAVSQNTKNDIERLFDISSEKITVISEAAREQFSVPRNTQRTQQLKQAYDIGQNYLLFIGTLEPRKNLVRLLKAYKLLPAQLQKNYQLVIVGRKGWYYKEIFSEIAGTPFEKNVIFTGYVPDQDLPYLLHGATGFVLPSLYEGFGLPILEAFACGTPVITSPNSSLKEIAKKDCLYFDPYDIHDMKDKLRLFLEDETLRQRLSENLIARSKDFSWQKTAEGMLKVIRQV